MKLDVMLGFDMETDVGSWTPYYEGLTRGTPLLLDCLAEKGVTGTFYFTGDAATKHGEVVRAVRDAGFEVGCHSLYHETLGDELFPIPGMQPLLAHEVRPRLELATHIVEEACGEKMLSFRCPRLFGSTAVVNALEDLGYVSDASYPMYFYRDRLGPYHPSREDWTAMGDMKIVEIPNFADMGMSSVDEFGRDRDQWPVFRTEGADRLIGHVKSFIKFMAGRGEERTCLCFYFHPWEFWPMPEGLIHYGEGAVMPDQFIVKNCGEHALEQLGVVIEWLKGEEATFWTARDLAGEAE